MSQASAASAAARPTRRQWLTLLVLSLGLAIVIIDGTIVNVAIPSIRKEFNATLQQLEWVNSIYALIYAALIVTWGRVGDQIGRKRIFIAGVVMFVIGSLMAGAASSIGMLIGARVVQGLGAAMTSPSTLSIVSATFTGRARGIAFGIWGAVAGASAALGPLLGGWLTTNATWRWAFYINLPIGLIAVLGALFLIQESRDTTNKLTFDIPGILLTGFGIGAAVFGLIEGQTYGWLEPKRPFSIGSWTWPLENVSISLVSLIVGFILLAIFVWWELRVKSRGQEPLFDFSLARFTSFRFGLITVAIVALGEFGIIFVLSLYLQSVLGRTAFQTGLIFLPFAVATLFTAPTAGVLSSRFGAKWVVTIGMMLEALAIFALSRVLKVDTPIGLIIAVLVLYGIGVGLAIAQLTSVVLSEVPPHRLGAGSGANNTIRQVGAAIGVAIIGAVLTTGISTSARSQLDANQTIPSFVKTAIVQQIESGGAANEGQASLEGAPAGIEKTPAGQAIVGIIKQSFVDGARRAAVIASVFVLLGALSSLLIPNTKMHSMQEVTAGH